MVEVPEHWKGEPDLGSITLVAARTVELRPLAEVVITGPSGSCSSLPTVI